MTNKRNAAAMEGGRSQWKAATVRQWLREKGRANKQEKDEAQWRTEGQKERKKQKQKQKEKSKRIETQREGKSSQREAADKCRWKERRGRKGTRGM